MRYENIRTFVWKKVPQKYISSIPDKKLTPAKLMNIYINNQQNKKEFLEELIR